MRYMRTHIFRFIYRVNTYVELGCPGRYGRRAILLRAHRPPSRPQLGHLLVCALYACMPSLGCRDDPSE